MNPVVLYFLVSAILFQLGKINKNHSDSKMATIDYIGALWFFIHGILILLQLS